MADTPWTAEGLANWLEVRMRGDSAIPPTILEALLSYLRDPARAAAPEMAELLERWANSGDDMNALIDETREVLNRIRGEDNAS